MSLTIGRATLSDPTTWSQDGKTLSLSGIITPSGSTDAERVGEMIARYYQITNLVDNPDEDVYPLTFSLESRLNGYYRVTSSNCTPIERALDLGYAEWDVELEQIPNFANPVFEITYTSVVRSNSHGVVSGNAILTGFGEDNSNDYNFSGTVTLYNKLAEGITGNLKVPVQAISSPTVGYVRNSAPPDDYYEGACLLEIEQNGTLYPVVGRQIPAGSAGVWRISNGLCELKPNSGSVGFGTFGVWASSTWEYLTFTGVDYSGGYNALSLFSNGPSLSPTWADATVVRNDPEQVTLRFDWIYGHTEYVTIRRGCNHIELTIIGYLPVGGTSPRPGVRISTFTAATAVTGGMRATANNASGNRFVFATPVAVTTDLVNGRMYTTNVTQTATFLVGLEKDGSSSSTPYTVANMWSQFMCPVSAKTMVVAR